MHIQLLQHAPFEGAGRIDDWSKAGHHTLRVTRLFAGDLCPDVATVDAVIVMGGPMGANDERQFPWMRDEKKWIESALSAEKKVLGICLGAQLLAAVMGAKVYRNQEKEIGWFPIELNPPNVRHHPLNVLPQRATVFHWHGDTFDLPNGASHLARSRACENQAFAVGPRVVGLQFHLEMAGPQIDSLIRHAAGDLTGGAFVQDSREMLDLAPTHAPPLGAALFRFLDGFLKAELDV